jgi:hypothetical protein
MVEVRSLGEILATLDAEGKLAGLPFMPEMQQFCGRKFRVYRRAEKVFLDRLCYVARLQQTVLLEGVRCDGQAHAGCQMRCLLFWKEAWLKPAEPTGQTASDHPPNAALAANPLPISNGERFCCQATELVAATSRLPWWDLRQYFWELVSGEITLRQLVRALFLLACNKVRRMCGRQRLGLLNGKQTKTVAEALGLQPGELVQVKSRQEIEATLDSLGRNRGLGFAPEMLRCCGGTYRVAGRVEKLIVEWSGQLRQVSNTVVLEGAECDGVAYRLCPRSCYHLWRETWLRRLPQAADPASGEAVSE